MSQTMSKKNHRKSKKKSPWPMVVLVSGGLLLILAFVFAYTEPLKPKAKIEVTGKPSLKVDQEKVDLGNVKLGKIVEVSFQLTNVGDQTLRFKETPTIVIKDGC
jgi:cell division septal protein FtsQ